MLKLRQIDDFKWEEKYQVAFDKIKQYLSQPHVLVPPREEIPLRLYISAANESIGCLLAQNNSVGHEHAIYYLSKILSPTEVKYTYFKKLCLALYFACTKLRHYLLKHRVYVISQTDMIKYILNRPVLSGKIGKWLLGLIELNLVYFPQKSVKGQALEDFLADHPTLDTVDEKEIELLVCRVEIQPWIIKFDGSSTEKSAGVGVVITSLEETKIALSFNLDCECTNNQVEYEALIIGLQIL